MDNSSNSLSHDQIADRARQIWKERGQPGGRDLEFWLDAERQLRDEAAGRGGRRRESNEAEKRLDGMTHQPPSPARRTPKGEAL